MNTAGTRYHSSGLGRNPSWSPDGRWIVFTYGDYVKEIRPNGQAIRHILYVTRRRANFDRLVAVPFPRAASRHDPDMEPATVAELQAPLEGVPLPNELSSLVRYAVREGATGPIRAASAATRAAVRQHRRGRRGVAERPALLRDEEPTPRARRTGLRRRRRVHALHPESGGCATDASATAEGSPQLDE